MPGEWVWASNPGCTWFPAVIIARSDQQNEQNQYNFHDFDLKIKNEWVQRAGRGLNYLVLYYFDPRQTHRYLFPGRIQPWREGLQNRRIQRNIAEPGEVKRQYEEVLKHFPQI